MAKRHKNGQPIGLTYATLTTDVAGWAMQGPLWYGAPEERVPSPTQVVLSEHELGWVIRLGDTPLIGLNTDDLTTLGVALIRAAARRA